MSTSVRIPADVERDDTVLAGLTARQLLLLSGAGIVLYAVYMATRAAVPPLVFLGAAVPLAVAAAVLALGRRDGLPLDRLLLAALRQRLAPRYRVTAPEGLAPAPAWLAARARPADEPGSAPGRVSPARLRLPAQAVTEAGVIDLGRDGLALVAVCSTVNFALRTPAEQDSLTAAFGRYLHSLADPIQILVRAERLDLSVQISEVRAAAAHLPHPALEHAALEHAGFLAELGRTSNLLRRQVLLILREPLRAAPSDLSFGSPGRRGRRRAARGHERGGEAARRAAETRLARRVEEAGELLAPVGITVTALDPGQATAVLAAACNPDSLLPPSSGTAADDDVITSPTPPSGATDDGETASAAPWTPGGEAP